jgi:hypothetical protein
MPYVNADGNVAHGIGGSGAYLNNARIDAGGGACWYDRQTIAYQHEGADGVYVALYDVASGARRRAIADPGHAFYGKGANALYAGGGVWAAWLAGFGLFTSTGLHLPAAGLVAVGDDGALAYVPDYQSGVPVVVRDPDGAEWTLTAGVAYDVRLYGQRRATFNDPAQALYVVNLPAAVTLGPLWRPRAALVNGEWWLSYFCAAGVVLHPFAALEGFIVVPPGHDAWQDVAALETVADTVQCSWSVRAGEVAGDIVSARYNILADPRVPIVEPPPPIDPPIPPEPPPIDPEIETMKPPIVTVDTWTLDQVDDGKEFRFHDDGNPEHRIAVRVWVEGGSMRAEITNSAGTAATLARRAVTPCASTTPEPPPIDPEPPIEPPVEPPATPAKFTLKRHDVSNFLAVGSDKFLVQGNGGATFEVLELSDGYVALKANGKYCAAEDDRRVKADRDECGTGADSWERWTPAAGEKPDTVAFRSRSNLYLSAHDDGTVAADQPVVGGWESFVQAAYTGPALNGRLRIDGRMWRDDIDYYRPVWVDALDILTLEHEPYLDWAVATGFGGVRVFCGNTGRGNNQTPESALANLPAFLACARARGLRVEVTALTGTESGYDARQYIADAAGIADGYENAVFEMANEPWHPSQKDLTPDFLCSCQSSVPARLISALGAAESDESSEYAGGPYITAHLDRSRDEWNMVRRVRELEALSDANGKPVMNNEPIKAGSQNNNPAIFFTMAVLNRGFEVGGIFHSDDGLAGRVPAPGGEQQTLAEAYIRGSRVITTRERMTYKNAGWHDSPVKEFTGAVRVYSFMADQNVSVALGIEVPGVTEGAFSITMQNGWQLGPVLDEMPGVRVYQLVR